MADARPYHHGNLREALLTRAQEVLRERGAAALTLRELARDVGVSHGAPRRHFPDRQALLDALALEGFAQLGATLRIAREQAPGEFADQLRATGLAYIAFATHDADLLELMFASKHGEHADEIEQAALGALSVILELIVRGQAESMLPDGDPERISRLQLATIHGIASLINGGMFSEDELDGLVEDAVSQFLAASRAASF
jgi:AcrR family transcriptional regulator